MISTLPAGTVAAVYFATRTRDQFVKALGAIDDAQRNPRQQISPMEAARRAPAGTGARDAAQIAGYVPDTGAIAMLRLQATNDPGSVAKGSMFNLIA